jgi:hypothetical protein
MQWGARDSHTGGGMLDHTIRGSPPLPYHLSFIVGLVSVSNAQSLGHNVVGNAGSLCRGNRPKTKSVKLSGPEWA